MHRHGTCAGYTPVGDWLKLPAGRPQLGNMHGDIAVSSKGEVFVSVQDPAAGAAGLRARRHLPAQSPRRTERFPRVRHPKAEDGEFIYGPRVDQQSIVKMTLDGKKVLEIPASAIPDEFKKARPTKKNAKGEITKNPDEGKRAPDRDGCRAERRPLCVRWLRQRLCSPLPLRREISHSFGGKKEPYNFNTLHKIAIDTRFTPARIIGVDRTNGRVVHMGLDGKFLGVVATDMLLPAAVAIQGEYAARSGTERSGHHSR